MMLMFENNALDWISQFITVKPTLVIFVVQLNYDNWTYLMLYLILLHVYSYFNQKSRSLSYFDSPEVLGTLGGNLFFIMVFWSADIFIFTQQNTFNSYTRW